MNTSVSVKGKKGFQKTSLVDRFFEKVTKDPNHPKGCWVWIGGTRGFDRPSIYVNGRLRPSTQVSWEIEHRRPFPEGKMACHTCDNPECVNPYHIWPGTMRDNLIDASVKGRLGVRKPPKLLSTHCKRGHLLEGENVYVNPKGMRCCYICKQNKNAEYRQRYREVINAKNSATRAVARASRLLNGEAK